MLRQVKLLLKYNVLARDGEFGFVDDLLFDDREWMMRFLVIDTGTWLSGRKVLIPPHVIDQPDWGSHVFPVRLSKEQIKDSPPLDTNEPVSLQHEHRIFEHYNISPRLVRGPVPAFGSIGPDYDRQGEARMTAGMADAEGEAIDQEDTSTHEDHHLRSASEIMKYRLRATDGEIGDVEDLLLDDSTFHIRYLVVDTGSWLSSRKVIIAVPWIENVSWEDASVAVDFTRKQVEESPEWDASIPVKRPYEDLLFTYYGRPKYWIP
jgi:hypothetical protein